MSPERLAEIRDLLKYESSIAFYSHRAKESMLLLLAEAEEAARLRARVAELEAAAQPIEADPILDTLAPDEAAPEEPTAARLAADAIQAYRDPTVIGYVVGVDRLSLTLRPRDLRAWRMWADLLNIDTPQVTHRGGMSTADGEWDGVPVAVTVVGLGQLLAAALRAEGGVR